MSTHWWQSRTDDERDTMRQFATLRSAAPKSKGSVRRCSTCGGVEGLFQTMNADLGLTLYTKCMKCNAAPKEVMRNVPVTVTDNVDGRWSALVFGVLIAAVLALLLCYVGPRVVQALAPAWEVVR